MLLDQIVVKVESDCVERCERQKCAQFRVSRDWVPVNGTRTLTGLTAELFTEHSLPFPKHSWYNWGATQEEAKGNVNQVKGIVRRCSTMVFY
jgi:hypothetical protein